MNGVGFSLDVAGFMLPFSFEGERGGEAGCCGRRRGRIKVRSLKTMLRRRA